MNETLENMNKQKNIIVVVATTTALIDDELSFADDSYRRLIKENEKLEGKDFQMFLRVEAGLSSGNGVYSIIDSKLIEGGDQLWGDVLNYLNNLNINTVDDILNSKNVERYLISW